MSENLRPTNNDHFVFYPIDSLIAAFNELEPMKMAISELKENGFAREDVRSFVGEDGIGQMDFDGSENGSMTELLRFFQRMGPDRIYLERYEKYMRDGSPLLMVYAPKEQRKQLAADIMRKHSPNRVTYFGILVIEEI